MLEDYTAARVGVEGLEVKALGDPYQPGHRGWLKLRIRSTAEAIVGAVLGSLEEPRQLVLGLPGEHGTMTVAGRTGPLRPAQRAAVARFLRPPGGPHPWPSELPVWRLGRFGRGDKVEVTLVEPSLVVEVSADTAFEYGKWRHVTTVVRARPELAVRDVGVPQDYLEARAGAISVGSPFSPRPAWPRQPLSCQRLVPEKFRQLRE